MKRQLFLYTCAFLIIPVYASQKDQSTQEEVKQIAELLEQKYEIYSLAGLAVKPNSSSADAAIILLKAQYKDILAGINKATNVLKTIQQTTTSTETSTLELINRAQQILHDPQINSCDPTKIRSIMTALSQTNLAYEFWYDARRNELAKQASL